jgi:molecular chaperone DnaJ
MLSRSDCFKVLGLDESAGPNAIKSAYRKLAFELHPDLNPDIPDASQNFQRLNEAYVLLMQEYANTSFAADGRSNAYAENADSRARAGARKAYEKAGQASASSSWGSGFKKEQGHASSSRADFKETAGSQESATNGANGSGAHSRHSTTREDILRDLLKDPFARRVFEDIFSHVRYNSGKGGKPAGSNSPSPPKKIPKKIRVASNYESPLLALGKQFYKLAGGIKGWLRKQIDDEQTIFLPGESLMPGARIRLHVQHGFSGEKKTIEVTLPPEFVPGNPFRLKGLGRHVGSLQGDLYLRVFRDEGTGAAEETKE